MAIDGITIAANALRKVSDYADADQNQLSSTFKESSSTARCSYKSENLISYAPQNAV